jgi:hypothetical protein
MIGNVLVKWVKKTRLSVHTAFDFLKIESTEHSNQLLGAIKSATFFYQRTDYKRFKKSVS